MHGEEIFTLSNGSVYSENLLMEVAMEKVYLIFPIVQFTKAILKMVKKMVKAYLY